MAGTFLYESGAVGSGVWCFNSEYHLDQTVLVGTEGQITFATFDTSPIKLTTATGTENFPIDNPAHVHQPLIQSIVDELNGEGRCPSTGESAARTTWVTDQLLREYYESHDLSSR